MPQDLIQSDLQGNAVKGAPKINCQHPYNSGKYSPRTKCEQAGIVSNHIIQDYKPTEAGCSNERPCKPGYKCGDKGVCKQDLEDPSGKALENFDYRIKMPGICPGYDLENTIVPVPGYRAYDFNKVSSQQAGAIMSEQVARHVLPGNAQITLKLGDFFDRAIWGNSPEYKNWTPTATWILPQGLYNPSDMGIYETGAQARNAKVDSVPLKDRPTLQLGETPVIGVLNEVLDSMKSHDWFYDFNFAYNSWTKNTGAPGSELRLKYLYEIDVTNKVNFIGKCVEENLKRLEIDTKEIDELALPFAYEPDDDNKKSTNANQNQFKGNFSGIIRQAFVGTGCIGTSYDTSVVSVSPTTLEKLPADNLASMNNPDTGFNISNPIYNHIKFDIRNESVGPDKKGFLFTSALNEADKKQIFNYVVRADHNNLGTGTTAIKALIAEYEGTSHYGRPFFYAARQIPINLSPDFTSDIGKGIIDVNLKPEIAGKSAKYKNFNKLLLNDKITKETTTTLKNIKEKDQPTTLKGKPEWKFAKGSKLKREWFRDYLDLSLGELAL